MADVSVSFDSSVTYPMIGDHCPQRAYAEYPFKFSGVGGNQAYDLVRRCLKEFGGDREHFDTPAWNPLGQWIKPGDNVFVLPNFVMNRRSGESLDEFYAKCTHGSVLRAVIDYATIACRDAQKVSFGNAPIQACEFDRVTEESGAKSIAEFYQKVSGATIGPYDLRLLVARWTRFGALLERKTREPECAVPVDLGADSWLDELFRPQNTPPKVRVGDYPPAETMSYHGPGKHIYVINRRVLDADVIISVPKLKTHQKVGITSALKGTVGAIARKECLAHYRRGAPEDGGDEYPRSTPTHDLVSWLTDKAAGVGTDLWSNLFRVQSKLLVHALRARKTSIMNGAWYGNDTAWRMALDIARILRYVRRDGTLSTSPQRRHLTFVDGVVAGEGEGPLDPRPRHMGTILFSPDICAADVACALIMGYDPRKIPLVENSFVSQAFPITEGRLQCVSLVLNGQPIDLTSVDSIVRLIPPKGWIGRIERNGSHSRSL